MKANYFIVHIVRSKVSINLHCIYVRFNTITYLLKELKRFQRVELAPGETKTVTFELPVEELAFWNIDMEYVVEPGDFRLWVAGDSDSGNPVNFAIL